VEQFDWQMKGKHLVGQSTGTFFLMEPELKPDECTTITMDQLRRMLLFANNSFAEGNVFFGRQSLAFRP
jgi:hypothetical protein